ncbi:MAG: class I SAM-dependent methyltransferase [Myxococcota bacterium]|nr:class I SAM-dependent methyltransferase [Myxococcota bacterium]MEC8425787.1 class I SAM-dependent methyltransferase [Myxococcota bacterium]
MSASDPASFGARIAAASRALLRRGKAPGQPLSARLRAVADRVPVGARVLDVGTDHAWLVVHLLHERRTPFAIAADSKQAPLAGAADRLHAHRLQGVSETRLGNGLSVVQPGEVAAVTICGMGGRRIADICAARPAVVAALDALIVQPNTEPGKVRAGLRDMGLRLADELLVQEEGRWYPVMVWVPGTPERDWDALDIAHGPLLRDRADPALRRFLGEELGRVAQALASAIQGGAPPQALRSLQEDLDSIERELARLAIAAGTISKRANKE